jgi:hypothetical protein
MTVIRLLWMRFRVLYLLLAAEWGGAAAAIPGPGEGQAPGMRPSCLAHSSCALLFLLDGLSGASGSDLDLWKRGSLLLSF